jgi:7-carboxy-7-deazaguanine synthase
MIYRDKASVQQRLRLTEIFFSLQGETRTVGLPTVFIRLTGCPLRCTYCDTAYAFHGGEWHTFPEIIDKVKSYKTHYVTVTGGEPLAQKPCIELLKELCDLGYEVSLETSGALDVSGVDKRVVKILDIKTPASGESSKNLLSNLSHLSRQDQIKFVICNRQDYEWSRDLLQEYQLAQTCDVLFSPSYGEQPAKDLAEWVLNDQLPVRLQIQLHKYLWGNEPGR